MSLSLSLAMMPRMSASVTWPTIFANNASPKKRGTKDWRNFQVPSLDIFLSSPLHSKKASETRSFGVYWSPVFWQRRRSCRSASILKALGGGLGPSAFMWVDFMCHLPPSFQLRAHIFPRRVSLPEIIGRISSSPFHEGQFQAYGWLPSGSCCRWHQCSR